MTASCGETISDKITERLKIRDQSTINQFYTTEVHSHINLTEGVGKIEADFVLFWLVHPNL